MRLNTFFSDLALLKKEYFESTTLLLHTNTIVMQFNAIMMQLHDNCLITF